MCLGALGFNGSVKCNQFEIKVVDSEIVIFSESAKEPMNSLE